MTNGIYPDTIYDKDMKIFRIVREFNNDGTVVVENGSRRGIKLIPSEYSLRRFTKLFDANSLPIYEGDIISTGMRRGDDAGWTEEVVAWQESCNEWALLPMPNFGHEFMQMQHDRQLRKLTGKSIFELRCSVHEIKGNLVQCPECGERGHGAAFCDNLG